MSEAGVGTLSRQEIDALLRELGAELECEGVRGDLFVVGDAVMVLAYNLRRITADVDAIFEPKEAVYRAARRIAVLHPELPEDRLYDAVKGFLPGNDPDAEVAIAERHMGAERLGPKARFIVEELFGLEERTSW